MWFNPVQQMQFAASLSQLAMTATTTTMATTASAMANNFEAVAESYGPKNGSASKASSKRKSTRTKSTRSASRSRKTSAGDFASVGTEMMELAFAPAKIIFDACGPENWAAKNWMPKETAPVNFASAWMAANPFLANNSQGFSFSPFMAGSSRAPFGNLFAQPQSLSFFPELPDYMSLTARSPFAALPWMAMFGFKRERSAFEKITDPFEIGSNVIPFPSWATKNVDVMRNPMQPMLQEFEPAKIAAGMAALFVTPKFLNVASSSSPWSIFGA